MPSLKVLNNPPTWRSIALRAYRVAVLVVIVLMMRDLAIHIRVQGDAPITLNEVRKFLPGAASTHIDDSPRRGLFVDDASGKQIGYAMRTRPISDTIIGYSGPTDTLVVFDDHMQVVGIHIRSSSDTYEHVDDIAHDNYFMHGFNGMSWDKLGKLDLRAEGIEGVSGATLTSMTIAHGIVHRVQYVQNEEASLPSLQFRWSDIGLILVLIAAIVLCFTHLRGKKWVRRGFQAVVIGYVGFYSGDLLAQSLLTGWANSGIAWRIAPGLVLLAAAALIIPLTTRRAIYCSHICPHGAAQEWIGNLVPWRIKLPHSVAAGLKWLPPLLLAMIIAAVMLRLPFNPAGAEPFDAYLIRTAGWATISVAIIGLIAAAFIPQAYCKYGCPTGSLLEFFRSHGRADHFGRRDFAAAAIVALVAIIWWKYTLLWHLIAPALHRA